MNTFDSRTRIVTFFIQIKCIPCIESTDICLFLSVIRICPCMEISRPEMMHCYLI